MIVQTKQKTVFVLKTSQEWNKLFAQIIVFKLAFKGYLKINKISFEINFYGKPLNNYWHKPTKTWFLPG